MIIRLIRTNKMSARNARKKGYTSVVLASAWEEYHHVGSEETAPPEIMHPLRVSPKLEVYGIRWPEYDDFNGEIHLVDPDDSANALVKALKTGKPMRQTAESLFKGEFLTDLAKAARVVSDGANITPTKLLACILGDGHIQDETLLPLACAMAEEQLESERLERCKPVPVRVDGREWLADPAAGWVANGPQPVDLKEIREDARKELTLVDFGAFVSSRTLGQQLQIESSSEDRLSFVGGIEIDPRFAPLLQGRTAHAARIYNGSAANIEQYTGVVLLDSDGNRVAVIAPYMKRS